MTTDNMTAAPTDAIAQPVRRTEAEQDKSLSKERVFMLCEQLKKEGKNPTQAAIRNANGGVGSSTTISKYLTLWRDEQRTGPAKEIRLPEEIGKSILAYVERELNERTLQLSTDLAERQSELDGVVREAGGLQNQVDELGAKLADSLSEIAKLSGKTEALQGTIESLTANVNQERQAAEAARRELVEANLLLKGLPETQEQLKEAQQALEAMRDGRTKAEREAAVLAARIEAMTQAHQAAIANSEAACAAKIDALQREHKAAMASVETAKSTAEERLNASINDLAKQAQKSEGLAQEVKQLQQRLHDAELLAARLESQTKAKPDATKKTPAKTAAVEKTGGAGGAKK